MAQYLIIAGCCLGGVFLLILAVAPCMLSSRISREEEAAMAEWMRGREEEEECAS